MKNSIAWIDHYHCFFSPSSVSVHTLSFNQHFLHMSSLFFLHITVVIVAYWHVNFLFVLILFMFCITALFFRPTTHKSAQNKYQSCLKYNNWVSAICFK